MNETMSDAGLNIINTLCIECVNYNGAEECRAFPEGIPSDILNGSFVHDKPHEGDNGIQFEPIA